MTDIRLMQYKISLQRERESEKREAKKEMDYVVNKESKQTKEGAWKVRS
jgi:hypothetical protein